MEVMYWVSQGHVPIVVCVCVTGFGLFSVGNTVHDKHDPKRLVVSMPNSMKLISCFSTGMFIADMWHEIAK